MARRPAPLEPAAQAPRDRHPGQSLCSGRPGHRRRRHGRRLLRRRVPAADRSGEVGTRCLMARWRATTRRDGIKTLNRLEPYGPVDDDGGRVAFQDSRPGGASELLADLGDDCQVDPPPLGGLSARGVRWSEPRAERCGTERGGGWSTTAPITHRSAPPPIVRRTGPTPAADTALTRR